MPIPVICPHCQTPVTFPEVAAGQMARCHCGGIVIVPFPAVARQPYAPISPPPANSSANPFELPAEHDYDDVPVYRRRQRMAAAWRSRASSPAASRPSSGLS